MKGKYIENTYHSSLGDIHYYEVKNDLQPLVMIHAQRANQSMKKSEIVKFDCGHGIHIEKKKEFLHCFNVD